MDTGDENVNAATESQSQSTENSGAGTAAAPAQESAQDNPTANAGADAGAGIAGNATPASSAPAATTPTDATPEVAASGDPGDEQPELRVAKDMANVKIVVDGQSAQHSFYPNSTKLGDSLREVLRRTLNLDLDSLVAAGPVSVTVDGVPRSLDDNSLDSGVHDGSEISLSFS